MTRPVRFDLWDRRDGIGASEWSALAGVSPWASAATIWLEKVGLGTSRETSPMRAGRDLETTVLRIASRQLGRRLAHNQMTFPHPDWPQIPLYGTPDGFTRDGPRSLVEIKVVGHRMDDWKGGPPVYVDWQVQAQLACLPRIQTGIVAALIGGDVRTWKVERDPEVQALLPDLVAGWWRDHVLGDSAPDPSSVDDRWALLRAFARTTPDRQERIATPQEQAIGTQLRREMAERIAVDDRIELLRLELADASQEYDVGGVGWKATWSNRATTDWRAIAHAIAGEPVAQDVIEAHTKSTRMFTFRQGRD